MSARKAFTFPWALYVTSNRRKTVRTASGGKSVVGTTREYRERKKVAHLKARNQASGEPLAGPVQATILVRFPDRRRRDVTNVPKMFLDALEGVAYQDDHQVKICTVAQIPGAYDDEEAGVDVFVEPVDHGDVLERLREDQS